MGRKSRRRRRFSASREPRRRRGFWGRKGFCFRQNLLRSARGLDLTRPGGPQRPEFRFRAQNLLTSPGSARIWCRSSNSFVFSCLGESLRPGTALDVRASHRQPTKGGAAPGTEDRHRRKVAALGMGCRGRPRGGRQLPARRAGIVQSPDHQPLLNHPLRRTK